MLNDDDLICLENYLDGELSPVEADDLRQRLAENDLLSARLHEMREQRAVRVGLWQALEPAESIGDRLAVKVRRDAHRLMVRSRVLGLTRWAGSVAAVLVIGFGSGWLTHQRLAPPAVIPSAGTDTVAVANNLANPPIEFIGAVPGAPAQPYQVVLSDEAGKVIGVQQFDSRDKAQRFREDWDRWHSQQKQVQDGRINFVSHEY